MPLLGTERWKTILFWKIFESEFLIYFIVWTIYSITFSQIMSESNAYVICLILGFDSSLPSPLYFVGEPLAHLKTIIKPPRSFSQHLNHLGGRVLNLPWILCFPFTDSKTGQCILIKVWLELINTEKSDCFCKS